MALFVRLDDPEAFGGGDGGERPSEMATVSRAATRGAAPTDPRLRAAARNLAIHQLNQFRRQRFLTLPVFGLGTVGYVAAAIFCSPWWALPAIVFAGLLVHSLTARGRLQRRIDRLADPF